MEEKIINYKIINTLGSGANATTFTIKIGSKYYALRKEKILDNEATLIEENIKNNNLLIVNDKDKGLYRQIYFNKFINKINKNHFTIIYKYYIDKCKFIQPLSDYVKNNSHRLDKYNELQKSNYCYELITDLKDGELWSILYILL